MSSQSSAQKRASKQALKAPKTLAAGQAAFLEDPTWLALNELIAPYLADPFSLSDENLQPIIAGLSAAPIMGAQARTQDALGRLSGMGLARGGATVDAISDVQGQLGADLAGLRARIQMQQLAQMWPDILNAMSTGSNLLQQRYAWDRDISNAQLGSASTLTQLAGQPGPAAMIGQGIGNLASSALGGWAQNWGAPTPGG